MAGLQFAHPRKPNAKTTSGPPRCPFAFWLGTSDPHRPFDPGSGERGGIDTDAIRLPAHFPDAPSVRSDVADYYWEVQRFDCLVGNAMRLLEEKGLLEHTIVIMTSDHGMPFPRCKSNVYDCGTRVPLAIRAPETINESGEIHDAFTSLIDLAPTLLELAGLKPPPETSGRSLVSLLRGEQANDRDHIVFGKERHVPSQEAPDMGGYPTRALRTYDFLYIRNYRPDRWPNGTPNFENAAIPGAWYADTDAGPTKTYIINERERNPHHQRLYELSFAKRAEDELYDLGADPEQTVDLASRPEQAIRLRRMRAELDAILLATGDPRATGEGDDFERHEYLGRGGPKHPSWTNR